MSNCFVHLVEDKIETAGGMDVTYTQVGPNWVPRKLLMFKHTEEIVPLINMMLLC